MDTNNATFKPFIFAAMVLIAVMLTTGNQSRAFAGSEDDFISFNTAPASDFTKIQIVEVPETVAKAIVSYRDAHGPYKTPEDLKKVPGMTEDLYDILDPVEEEGDIIFEKSDSPGGMNAY